MAEDFERQNLDWQIQQVQQRVEEWLEQVFSGIDPEQQLSGWELPNWLFQVLFWFVLLSFLGWAVWQIYQFLYPYWLRSQSPADVQVDSVSQIVGAEMQTVDEWLHRSRRAQQQGNYREACRMLYLAMVQQLDDRKLISASASRTGGEYLRLIQVLDQPLPYQILIQAHEQACFSENLISAELFDRCWQAYQEIQAQ